MIPLKLDNSNCAECWVEAALEAEATGRVEVRREDRSLVCVLAVSRDELVCDDAQCVEVRARLVAVEKERDELRAALLDYARHAADSGWHNLADEIRKRAAKEPNRER